MDRLRLLILRNLLKAWDGPKIPAYRLVDRTGAWLELSTQTTQATDSRMFKDFCCLGAKVRPQSSRVVTSDQARTLADVGTDYAVRCPLGGQNQVILRVLQLGRE